MFHSLNEPNRTFHRVQEFLEEKRVLYLRLRDPMFLSF